MLCQGDLQLRVVHTFRPRNNGGLTTKRSKGVVKKKNLQTQSMFDQYRSQEGQSKRTMEPDNVTQHHHG